MAVMELNSENFDQTIQDNDFVIIDFWAPWCAPCRTFSPIYEKVSEKHPDIVFAKVNTEEEQSLAVKFQVRSIPMLMIFREQIIIFAQPGMLAESNFIALIDKASDLNMDDVRKEIESGANEQ